MTSSLVTHTQKSELKADHDYRVRKEMAPVSECECRIVRWACYQIIRAAPAAAQLTASERVITRHTPAILALSAARAATIVTICNHG